MNRGERGAGRPALDDRQREGRPPESSGRSTVASPGRARTSRAEAAVSEQLLAAAERVWTTGDERQRPAGTVLRTQLQLLCAAAVDAYAGRTPTLHGVAPSAPLRAMLDALRSELLTSRGAPGVDVERVLDAIYALEALGRVLDADTAVHFSEHLAGRDGLELLVEVAHDLRSPLGSILFLAEALRKGHSGPVNSVQERQLGLVYSAAFGLSSLASDLMELARGGDRLVEARPVSFSVSSILRSVRDIVQPMAEEKGLEIRLVPPEADFRVGHPSALNRVLLNLTTNSLKFTATGHVEVSGRRLSRTEIEFSVRDTGRGIPQPVISSLFEAFRKREDTDDYLFSSAGLGLAICRKLVMAMGGELEVETAPDEGTRFYFILDLPLAARL